MSKEPLFVAVSNQKGGVGKSAFVALGMKENLSYHMARHSFGTLTLTAGIPIESIARMMGHTNIDSTQVYAQVTDRKISSDMNRLMERRKPAAGKEAAG